MIPQNKKQGSLKVSKETLFIFEDHNLKYNISELNHRHWCVESNYSKGHVRNVFLEVGLEFIYYDLPHILFDEIALFLESQNSNFIISCLYSSYVANNDNQTYLNSDYLFFSNANSKITANKKWSKG